MSEVMNPETVWHIREVRSLVYSFAIRACQYHNTHQMLCCLGMIRQVGPSVRETAALREHILMQGRMSAQWKKIPTSEHEHVQLLSEPDD